MKGTMRYVRRFAALAALGAAGGACATAGQVSTQQEVQLGSQSAAEINRLETLDDASAIEPGFPERMYARELPRTFAYGGMRDQIIA